MRDKYTNAKIRPYKGRMVQMKYTKRGETHYLCGEITASTRMGILFNVNKSEIEIRLTYHQIKDITEPVLAV